MNHLSTGPKGQICNLNIPWSAGNTLEGATSGPRTCQETVLVKPGSRLLHWIHPLLRAVQLENGEKQEGLRNGGDVWEEKEDSMGTEMESEEEEIVKTKSGVWSVHLSRQKCLSLGCASL